MNKLGEMKISKLILKMSLPAIISMMVQAMYNVVDSIFVAQISEEALTAVSLAFPIQLIIIAVVVGLGVGMNSVISRKLGAKENDEASNAAEHGFFLGIIVYVLLVIMAFTVPRWYFSMFTDNQIIIDYATKYITIILLFSFGRIVGQIGRSIMQATGDMVNPMRIQMVGAILNIVLDPIFIFGYFGVPAMGITGAAVATVLGQIISGAYAFILVVKHKKGLELNLKKFHYESSMIKQILTVGLPVMIMQGLGSVMITALNLILAGFGDTTVAVLGVYYKAQSFIFMPVFGLSQGIMTIIGYNYGAKNGKRVVETIKVGSIIAFSMMLTGTIIFQVFPKELMNLFNSSPEMTEIGIKTFRIISIGFPIAAISIILATAFQAIGEAYISLINSIARQIIILIPAAYILSKSFGVAGVWMAFPIAEVGGIIIILIFAMRIYKNKIKPINN